MGNGGLRSTACPRIHVGAHHRGYVLAGKYRRELFRLSTPNGRRENPQTSDACGCIQMCTDEAQMPWIARRIDPRYRRDGGDSTLALNSELLVQLPTNDSARSPKPTLVL